MREDVARQLERKMIESSNGEYCICLDKESDWNGWAFQKHPDGQWVSLRLALPSEVMAAQQRLNMLELIADLAVRG